MMNELEKLGLEVFTQMDLNCFGGLGNTKISEAFPDFISSRGENLEFDYFIVYDDVCLVGEITARSGDSNVEGKYKKFRDQLNLLKNTSNKDKFKSFNIPADSRYMFTHVRKFVGFFIITELEKYDLYLTDYEGISVIYGTDWDILKNYSNLMGKFAKYPFLSMVNIPINENSNKKITLEKSKHKLVYEKNKVISKSGVRADVFTFIICPEDLLSVSEVYRRELTPKISSGENDYYQRSLDIDKIDKLKELVDEADFMFPNNILVSLSEMCEYDMEKEELTIPIEYGAVSVIDGQHRLFSYSNRQISDYIRKNARIMVTALKYHTQSRKEMIQCSATTFIEINQNQKRISSDHIDEIAFSVLGETTPKALAAQVLLTLNQKQSKVLSGFFSGSTTSKSIYKAATIISQLSSITNIEFIKNLHDNNSISNEDTKNGYINLFCVEDLSLLKDPNMLIEKSSIVLERYCNLVKKTFSRDWPERGKNKPSTLEYTKVFAAYIKLLSQFIKEGLVWADVENELNKIKYNIFRARSLDINSSEMVLSKTDERIPDDASSINDTFRFLNTNRKRPSTIRSARLLSAEDLMDKKKASSKTISIFESTRKEILEIDENIVEEDVTNHYIAYKADRVFAYIIPYKNYINVILNIHLIDIGIIRSSFMKATPLKQRNMGEVLIKLSRIEQVDQMSSLLQLAFSKNK